MTNPAGAPAPVMGVSSDYKNGLIFALLAYLMWGVLPVYMKSVAPAGAVEILCHRILWSVPFAALIISLRRQWPTVVSAITSKRTFLLLCVTSITITSNWLLYTWAVVNEHILEASLGYFINPLFYIIVGVFVLKEKLTRLQLVAISLAFLGVSILTVASGVVPWIALSLAISFTAYGYIKKTVEVGAMAGLFIETLIVSPIALICMIVFAKNGQLAFISSPPSFATLLVLAGPFTVIPLFLFATAARKISLSVLGFLQYLGPSIQFFLGLYYGEILTTERIICFAFIWAALAIFTFDMVKNSRKTNTG